MRILPTVCALSWCFSLIPLTAEVVINEIMFNIPRGENLPEPTNEEFIEISNPDTVSVSLEGWEIDAGVSFTFPSVSIPGGGFLIIAADPAAFATKYPAVTATVLGPWAGRLSNSGEKIRLRNDMGEEIDELTYSDDGDWALRRRGVLDSGHRGWVWDSPADGGGGSLELVNPDLSNRSGQNWVATAAGEETPGEINGVFSPDAAPMIFEVKHTPAIPSATDQVVITAALNDIAGETLSATLSYGTNSNDSSNRSVLLMKDDALNGDGDAGDGIFGVTLPAFPDGTVVDFYITASDGASSRTWPGPTDESGGQGANALYQVEEVMVTSDQDLPVYRLILSPDENEEFAFDNYNRNSNAQMNVTFIAQIGDDTDIRYQAGIRRRGAGSRSRNPRTMRLVLPGDQPWQDTRKMNLNAQYNYLQLFGQKLFAAARLPSAKARAVELFMNGADQANSGEVLYGAYVHMEPQGSESVARQFPDDAAGNLYSKRRPDNQLAYRDGDLAAYQADGWDKSTNNAEADWSDLDAWLAAVQDTENPNYLPNLESVMDIDQWVRWFGVMTLLGNAETNLSNGADDDYYVYAGRLDPRIKAVPHDLDTILGLGDGSAVTDPELTIYDMIERGDVIPALVPFISAPKVMQKYHMALRDLIEGPFAKVSFDEMITNCLESRVPPSVLTGMISFMDARRSYVRSVVNPNLTMTTNLPVQDGYVEATNASPAFSGTFNLSEATSVLVNGKPALINFTNGTWSIGGSSLIETPYVTAGSDWNYLDNGSDQGTAWRAVGFDDSGWKNGNGEFGYGDSDENTTILYGRLPFNFFNDGNSKYPTTYFRKVVNIADPSAHEDYLLRLKRDDGAAVYVNGTLYAIDNLTENAAFDAVAELAVNEPEEGTFFDFSIPASAFQAGSNTIAVEIHNAATDSSDLSFDLSLHGRNEPPSVLSILNPGVNRVMVEALDASGQVVETTDLDVWYDNGTAIFLSGTLSADTTLVAVDGPYLIDSDLVVPVGVTLTIEPGTSLLFGQGVSLTVLGRLRAIGTFYEKIQFSVIPGSGDTWDGVIFTNTSEDNRMVELDQNFSTSASHSVEVDDARLTLDGVRWRGTSETVLEASRPQMNVINCDFPPSSGSEAIHGSNLSGDQYFNLIGNVFQTSSGYNDIIDFSGGRRPGPVIYVLNNIFEGGTDDCLDLDGVDAHIEGNIFRNIHTDDPDRSSTANAIATDGDAHITIVRNVFDNVDHALLLKNESDAIFENNVVRRATLGAINFREPLRPDVDAGSDILCRGNIFIDNAVVFRFPNHLRAGGGTPNIVADRNIMPAAAHIYGSNNLDLDPAFVDAEGGDYRLLPNSPAMGSGINGADMGAAVPQGATVSGEPPALTDETSATLTVYMPGISGVGLGGFTTEYRWRLNGGAWSGDTDIVIPISLIGLALGDYQVEVLGKDSNGVWQTVPNASRIWTVTTTLPPVVRINELLADSSTGADWVEFYNAGSSAFNLGGFVISDSSEGIPGMVLPAGTMIGAKGFYRIELGTEFSLDRDGETFFLLESSTVVDSVTFGHQLTDLSISRLGRGASWGLSQPTPDAANIAMGSGDARLLKINEWVANPRVVICEDFVELYNPGNSPVALGGLFLTENPGGEVDQDAIPALTFIEGGGFVALDFSMNADSRNVALYTEDLEEIDLVAFTFQVEDTSYIRIPDGSGTIRAAVLPTPGRSNGGSAGTTVTNDFSLMTLDGSWNYEASGTDLGTGWRETAFDDSGWSTGVGLIGFEDDDLPAPGLQTTLADPQGNDPFIPTYYFRTEFTYTGDLEATSLFINAVFDDGGVVYMNGQALYRQGIDEDPSYDTLASFSGDATIQGPFMVPTGALVNGVNVIAAEIHQTSTGSSDVVFGLSLDAVETIFTPADDAAYIAAVKLMQNLRITEVMYDPAEGTAFEFIELQNIGTEPLELEGVRFVDGIDFVFPQMTLAPGAWIILVNDQASFESKYGAGLPVVGQYEGKLSNGGEEIVLQLPEPFAGNIQKFTYNDSWYPTSDGNGTSIKIINPEGLVRDWDDRLAWRAGAINGTPGTSLSISAGSHQVIMINETAILNGSVAGDWNPSISWAQISGPAPAGISSTTAASPSASFTLPGTYRFRFTASDGGTVLTSETSVAVDDRYDAWSARNNLTMGAPDDEDGDGIDNLMEYALDLDPRAKNGPVLCEVINGQFRYTRYLRKSDLTYELEAAADLEIWGDENDSLLATTPDEQLRAYNLFGEARKFVRLKVTR
jgi:hypothetical protein